MLMIWEEVELASGLAMSASHGEVGLDFIVYTTGEVEIWGEDWSANWPIEMMFSSGDEAIAKIDKAFE